MKYELYQYLMTDLWLVGIVIIIYVVILIIKVLRKYTKSVLVRKEKAENARTLGEVIKQHRVDCKMTQEFVAEILGVSRQAISKWENGVSHS
ncbi:MAG: helix-turn-helix transcriptional regulator [Anaerobutyricum hallii]